MKDILRHCQFPSTIDEARKMIVRTEMRGNAEEGQARRKGIPSDREAADGDHVRRHLRDQRLRRTHVDLQRPEVPVVDADDAGARVDRDRQFLRLVHLDQHVEPVPARVVTIRQVIIRREPIVIQAVTLEQLRGELRRARMAQTGYERQITRQYQTIQRLQAQVGLRLREAREADSQRASQLNAQFEVILQAFGLVVFAIIGALLVALCRTDSRAATAPTPALAPRAAIDWDPLQRQIHEAKSALATVETRLRHLEISISQERG